MSSDLILFAETNFRNQRRRFGIKRDDRRRHMYLIGKTGMGKSTVIENMIVQDIINGEGVALVDPHGDLAEKIINYVPSNRVNDVIYFNPADVGFPISFNVMEAVSQEHKHLVASGLVGVFKKLWADSWGPRLEYILRNAILALLDYPGSTLLGVNRMFVDKSYRTKVVAKIQDPVVKAFWVDEYAKYTQQFATEAVASIQNKIGQFLSTALIRNIVGQVKSTINIRDIMDGKKILIMNLSKGRIGEDASALLGAMMITKIQLAAMSRIDMPETQRNDFYLYVDEFQNFATESFANILSEARKYRLDLILAHQYIEQLNEVVSAAVFGNVGTIMCFRVGAADAEFLVKEFTPHFEEDDLVNLAKYEIYMKLMIDGVASNPFSAHTLTPLTQSQFTDNSDKIIRVTRERYGKTKDVVEDKIARWSGMLGEDEEGDGEGSGGSENNNGKRAADRPVLIPIKPEDVKPTAQRRAMVAEAAKETPTTELPAVEPTLPFASLASLTTRPLTSASTPKAPTTRQPGKFVVSCAECGTPTEVGFKPDGIRPVYCKNCFLKLRARSTRPTRSETPSSANEKPVEVVAPPAPEISLLTALQAKPVTFGTRRQPIPRVVAADQPEDGQPLPQSVTQAPAPESARIPTQVPSQTPSLTILPPGEVVEF